MGPTVTDNHDLEAPIAGVTVFRDGARVVRSGALSIGAGAQTVTVGDLPITVDQASVRVTVRSPGATLIDVEVHRRHRTSALRQESRELEAAVDQRRGVVQTLDDEDTAEAAGLGFLGHLSEAAATSMARAVGFGRLQRDELSHMGDQLVQDTASALARRRDIEVRRREARREFEAAEARLSAVSRAAEHPVEYVEVRAALEAAEVTDVVLEISYHVSRASWRPLYDIRVTGEKLDLSYLAEVTQQSGEDWPACDLVLSTTRRAHQQLLPELRPWYIGLARRAAGVGWAGRPGGAHPEMDTPSPPLAASAAMAAESDEPEAALPLMAEVAEAGAALTYRVPRPLAVPSDGGPHKVGVTQFGMEAVLDYVAAPVLAPEAYLRATVTNTSAVLIMPGPAHIFHESEFVGVTELETVAPGEEFELQLGADDRIRLERELRRRSTGKAMLGGTRTLDISYEIKIANHRAQSARITVLDSIPVSRDGEVKVKLREVTPKPTKQDDLGELTWELNLEPDQEAVVRYGFTVDHPSGTTLAGL